MVKKLKKVKKIKPFIPTIAPSKDKAWKAFSLWVRTKAFKNGQVQCYTCGRKYPITRVSAGHGIPGRSNAVLFLEEVVRPQCAGCNIWGHGQYRIFTAKLVAELGEKEYDRLSAISRKTIFYTAWEYLEIEQKYLQKLWELCK
jgi:hypothetical protein